MQRYDVLVVGAGPAGSATAIHLARGGARVLLADRARFPRDKPCGGGVTGRALRQAPCDISPVVERVVHTLRASAPPPPQLPAHEQRAADPDDAAAAARRVSRRAGGRGGRELPGRRPRGADRDRREPASTATVGGEPVSRRPARRRRRRQRRRRQGGRARGGHRPRRRARGECPLASCSTATGTRRRP